MSAAKFYRAMGGRKQLNGYIFAALITVMSFKLNASFETYCLYLAADLLGTSLIVAQEDKHRITTNSAPFPDRREGDSPEEKP